MLPDLIFEVTFASKLINKSRFISTTFGKMVGACWVYLHITLSDPDSEKMSVNKVSVMQHLL